MRNRVGILSGLVTALAVMAVHAQDVHAQVDMSGTWNMEVESANGTTNPTMMLTQDGMNLTGHYSSATLGEADVTGSVDGNTVTVEFSAMIEGLGQAPLTYSGSVAPDGTWTGELVADIQGQSFPLGTFTATKQ